MGRNAGQIRPFANRELILQVQRKGIIVHGVKFFTYTACKQVNAHIMQPGYRK
jgi:hypothetical protein